MNDRTETGSSFVQDLREAATRNPISAALIGMGVLWMLTGAKSPAGAGNAFRRAGLDRIPEALDDVRSRLKESVGSARRPLRRGARWPQRTLSRPTPGPGGHRSCHWSRHRSRAAKNRR